MGICDREEYLLEIWQDNLPFQCYLKGSTAFSRPVRVLDRIWIDYGPHPN